MLLARQGVAIACKSTHHASEQGAIDAAGPGEWSLAFRFLRQDGFLCPKRENGLLRLIRSAPTTAVAGSLQGRIA